MCKYFMLRVVQKCVVIFVSNDNDDYYTLLQFFIYNRKFNDNKTKL